jgi:hypothetical protein
MTIPLTIAGFAGGVAFFGEMSMDASKPIFVRLSLFPKLYDEN